MVKNITIKNKVIGPDKSVFITGEMACGYEGKFNLAKKLIKIASDARVDAIKMHITNLKDYIVPQHEAHDIVRRLMLKEEQWKELFNYAKSLDLLVLALPNDIASAKLASRAGTDAYFIHSANMQDFPLIKYIASRKKAIFLGIGGNFEKEIKETLKIIKKYHDKVILMHGFQAYPTKVEDAHLNYIPLFNKKYNHLVGFLDHAAGGTEYSKLLPLLAIPFGACAIEKHFTIDRKLKLIDYQSAMNPDELKNFVKLVKNIEKSFGSKELKPFSEDEKRYRLLCKKSIVAARDINIGEKITKEMIAFKRALPGLSPTYFKKVIGKKAIKKILKDENIFFKVLK
jgi:sialic acid synthase SpsE